MMSKFTKYRINQAKVLSAVLAAGMIFSGNPILLTAGETGSIENMDGDLIVPDEIDSTTTSADSSSINDASSSISEEGTSSSEIETGTVEDGVDESDYAGNSAAIELQTQLDNGTLITATAPAGSLPAGTQLEAMSEDLQDSAVAVLNALGYGSVADSLDGSEDLSKIGDSFTISFTNNGTEVDPAATVDIQITDSPVDMTSLGGNQLILWKIEDGEAAEIAASASGDNYVEFDTDAAVHVALSGSKPNSVVKKRGGIRRAMAQNEHKKTGVEWFDNSIIHVAKYITIEKDTEYAGKLEEGKFYGRFLAKVPAKEMFGWLDGHLKDTVAGTPMEEFYPHGKGKNIIGGVVVDINFPEGTSIDRDRIKIDKGTDAFSKYALNKGTYHINNVVKHGCFGDTYTNTLSYKGEDNAESILFTFSDQNFAGIYNTYKSNPDAIMTIEIPFSCSVNETGNVVAQGQSWSHITSNLIPAYVYTDVYDEPAVPKKSVNYGIQYEKGIWAEDVPETVRNQLPKSSKVVIGSTVRTPEKLNDVKFDDETWKFVGWEPETVEANSDVTVNAVWDVVPDLPRSYNVRYTFNYGGISESEVPEEVTNQLIDIQRDFPSSVKAGETIDPPEPKSVEISGERWDFLGWVKKGNNITGTLSWDNDSRKIIEDTTWIGNWSREKVSYNVTLEKGSFIDGKGKSRLPGSIVSVKAADPEENKVFSHWVRKDDGKDEVIVGYDITYKFYMPQCNTTITAAYSDKEVDKVGTSYMESVKKDVNNNKLIFTSIGTVPEGCTMLLSGIVATKDSTKAGNLSSQNADYVRGGGAGLKSYRWIWTKTKVQKDDTWFVRSYLKYRDRNNEIKEVYGDLVTEKLQ